jgi:hypothetical protein
MESGYIFASGTTKPHALRPVVVVHFKEIVAASISTRVYALQNSPLLIGSGYRPPLWSI